jgi:hypothetical protein
VIVLEALQYLGLPVLVGFFCSVLVGIGLYIGRGSESRLDPASRSRLLAAAAILPLLCGSLFFAAATAAWALSGPADICVREARTGHISLIAAACFCA